MPGSPRRSVWQSWLPSCWRSSCSRARLTAFRSGRSGRRSTADALRRTRSRDHRRRYHQSPGLQSPFGRGTHNRREAHRPERCEAHRCGTRAALADRRGWSRTGLPGEVAVRHVLGREADLPYDHVRPSRRGADGTASDLEGRASRRLLHQIPHRNQGLRDTGTTDRATESLQIQVSSRLGARIGP